MNLDEPRGTVLPFQSPTSKHDGARGRRSAPRVSVHAHSDVFRKPVPMPENLGDKMQLLAGVRPSMLKVVDQFVEQLLRNYRVVR